MAVDASGRLEINDISGTVEVSNNALTLLEGAINSSMVDVSNDALVSLKGAINNSMVDVSNDTLVSLKGAINNSMVDVSNDALVSLKGAINNDMVDVSNDTLVSLKGAINNSMVDVSNDTLVSLKGAINNSMVDVSVGNTVNVNITGGSTSGIQFLVNSDLNLSDASGTLFLGVTGDNSYNYIAVDASGRLEINDISGTVEVSNNALTLLEGAINNSMVDVSNDTLVSLKGAINNSMVDVSNDTLVSLKGAINNDMVDVSNDTLVSLKGAINNSMVDVSNDALVSLKGAINNSMVDVSNDALVSLKGAINNSMVDVSNDALVSLKGAINSSMVDVSNDALVSLKGAINNSMVDVSGEIKCMGLYDSSQVQIKVSSDGTVHTSGSGGGGGGGGSSGTEFLVDSDVCLNDASGTLMLGVTEDNSYNYFAVDSSGRLLVKNQVFYNTTQLLTDVSFSGSPSTQITSTLDLGETVSSVPTEILYLFDVCYSDWGSANGTLLPQLQASMDNITFAPILGSKMLNSGNFGGTGGKAVVPFTEIVTASTKNLAQPTRYTRLSLTSTKSPDISANDIKVSVTAAYYS